MDEAVGISLIVIAAAAVLALLFSYPLSILMFFIVAVVGYFGWAGYNFLRNRGVI